VTGSIHRCAGWRFVRPFFVAGLAALCCVAVGSAAEPPENAFVRAAQLSRSGRFEEASAVWREVADASKAAGATREQVRALVQLAEAQQALGRYADAQHALAEALEAAGAQADPAQRAAIHASFGNTYLALGPPAQAEEQLTRALDLARQAKAPALSAAVLTNLGNLHASRGEYAEATRAYTEAATSAEKAEAPGLAARAYANAARAGILGGLPPAEVRRSLERASALAVALPASHDQTYLLVAIGRSFGRLAATPGPDSARDLERAHALLVRAEQEAGRLGDVRARSYAAGELGALYEQQGRLDEALALSRRALFDAQQAAAPESVYRWHWQIGRILKAKGDTTGAIASYRQSVAVLQSVRFAMSHGYATGEGSFRETVGPVFFELVDLMLQTAPPASETAAYQARLLEVRETVELLKTAELRDYFRDECVEAIEAKVESLDQVSRSAAVLYPVLLPERMELLLTSADGVRRATTPVGAAAVGEEVRLLRTMLEKRTTQQFMKPARRVYDWLVRPFETELAALGVDTLVFVPDGPLRTIPISALHDGERFLIERFAVATTPGLSLTDPRPLDRTKLKVFLSGLSEGAQGFAPLPHVREELDAVAKLFPGETLLDADFRQPRVEQELGASEFGVVHIATHGEFSGDAEHSFLLTHDGRITMDDLGRLVGHTRFRDQPIELLTLSACETAEGDERAALGLAGVAVKAGARSALGTLWSVNDVAAATLVSDFYQELREQPVSKAVALQHAQQKLLANANTRHPFYWSAFLLISNWL
jgi:CHAT domain-containing protein